MNHEEQIMDLQNEVAARNDEVIHLLADLQRVRAEIGPGMCSIRRKRAKQIDKGYDADHDADHSLTDLFRALWAFAAYATESSERKPNARETALVYWPWEPETFNPDDTEDALASVGAMAAAIIDAQKAANEAIKKVFS